MRKRMLIMMSTYNGERYVADQIHSILNQETECEIVLRIRDDGSKDDTCKIIKEIQSRNKESIELIEGNNVGYNASFFELLSIANGFDYYAFSDQDDIWLPQKVQTAIEWLMREQEKNDGSLLYASTSYLVKDDMKPYGVTRQQIRPFTLYNTIVQNICPGHNQVMNQALLSIVQKRIKNVDVYVYDSWVANLAMLYGTILFNNAPQTYYRQHQSNELGSGTGTLHKLSVSFKHLMNGHGVQYRKQIESFIASNQNVIDETVLAELKRFISAKKPYQRIAYGIRSKLYRQKWVETIALKCAIITGRY